MPFAITVFVLALAQAPATLPPASHPDFPRHDGQVWDLQRRGLLAKAARQAWGSLHLQAHPFIYRLEFTNAQRTRAVAQISTNYSQGRAVVLEKVAGVWRIVRLGSEWIA